MNLKLTYLTNDNYKLEKISNEIDSQGASNVPFTIETTVTKTLELHYAYYIGNKKIEGIAAKSGSNYIIPNNAFVRDGQLIISIHVKDSNAIRVSNPVYYVIQNGANGETIIDPGSPIESVINELKQEIDTQSSQIANLREQIQSLKKNGIDTTDIENAVNQYLTSHPVNLSNLKLTYSNNVLKLMNGTTTLSQVTITSGSGIDTTQLKNYLDTNGYVQYIQDGDDPTVPSIPSGAVDLSNYYTKSQTENIVQQFGNNALSEVNNILQNYVSKEESAEIMEQIQGLIEPNFELLVDITTDTDSYKFNVTKDINNDPLRLKKAYVVLTWGTSAINAFNLYFNYNSTDHCLGQVISTVTGTGTNASKAFGFFEQINGIWKSQYSPLAVNARGTTGQLYNCGYQAGMGILASDYPYINQISSPNHTFPIGVNLKVYGIKANVSAYSFNEEGDIA